MQMIFSCTYQTQNYSQINVLKNLMELKTVLICAPDNFVPRVIENHGPISSSLLPTVRNLWTLLIRHSVLKRCWRSCANVFLSSLPVSDILCLSVNWKWSFIFLFQHDSIIVIHYSLSEQILPGSPGNGPKGCCEAESSKSSHQSPILLLYCSV